MPQVCQYGPIYELAPYVELLLIVPVRELSKVGQLKDQVHVVVFFRVNQLVKFDAEGVVDTAPHLNLRVHFVEVGDNLQSALLVVTYCPLSHESRLVHHLHGIGVLELPSALFIPPHNPLDLAEGTPTDQLMHLKLIHILVFLKKYPC